MVRPPPLPFDAEFGSDMASVSSPLVSVIMDQVRPAISHGRYVTFQMAEVAVPRQMFAEILSLIARLRAPSAPA